MNFIPPYWYTVVWYDYATVVKWRSRTEVFIWKSWVRWSDIACFKPVFAPVQRGKQQGCLRTCFVPAPECRNWRNRVFQSKQGAVHWRILLHADLFHQKVNMDNLATVIGSLSFPLLKQKTQILLKYVDLGRSSSSSSSSKTSRTGVISVVDACAKSTPQPPCPSSIYQQQSPATPFWAPQWG